jgi:transposase
MARRRTSMKKIREVIRLKSTTALSDRQIARALNIARPVVAKYWRGFSESDLSFDSIEDIPDSTLVEAIEKPRVEATGKYQELCQYFPYFITELKRRGVTLHLLWEEYKKKHPEGFQYSQFCYHFQMWRGGSDVGMHIKHKAGDKMFVDYAGDKVCYIDGKTGKEIQVETFVAVLGGSGLTYVEASESQEKENWIRSNERAFHYFRGSSSAIVPDNLRSAVTRADRYEPDINPDYAEFAEHYSTVIIPTRVREARDKALVENAVRLVYQRIYAPLRNRTFYSLEQLNEAIWELLEDHNNKNLQRMPVSRRELFERTERAALTPLPAERFAMKTTKWATVQFNYHVELRDDLHYYSVPYYLYKKEPKTKVKLVFDDRIVAIYYDNVRIVQYRRDRTPNEYTTLPEHMPDKHRVYAEWSAERFQRWARSIGNEVAVVVKKILATRKHPEQAFKACMGILSLAGKHGDERLNRICKRANRFGTTSVKRIHNMIKLDLEQESQQHLFAPIPDHENIRGSEYYH